MNALLATLATGWTEPEEAEIQHPLPSLGLLDGLGQEDSPLGGSKEKERMQAVLAKLDQCRVTSLDSPPPRPPTILSFKGKRLGEAGNLVSIQGQAKAGKSAAITGILGAALGGKGDCFEFESPNPDEKAVLHFDTEQSRCAHFDLAARAVRDRAGIDKMPTHFRTYSVLSLSVNERRQSIIGEMERATNDHGGIHMALLDGVADTASDPNDSQECFALVDELHALADTYQCLIVLVLHENPNSENKKTRGHLGSQLDRKAQTSIVIEKGTDEIVAMYAKAARDCNWPKNEAAYFKYDQDAGMHIAVPDPSASRISKRNSEKKVKLQSLAEQVVEGRMRHKDLKEAIMASEGVGDRTAASKIKEMLHQGILKKTNEDLYCLHGVDDES